MKKLMAIAAMIAAFGLGGAAAFAASTDKPADPGGGNDGQVCPNNDTGHISASTPSVTVTAPDGKLISGYCVKAGSANQGLGPESVTVDPPQKTVTITHSSGKDISHYSLTYVDEGEETTTETTETTETETTETETTETETTETETTETETTPTTPETTTTETTTETTTTETTTETTTTETTTESSTPEDPPAEEDVEEQQSDPVVQVKPAGVESQSGPAAVAAPARATKPSKAAQPAPFTP